MLKHLADQHKPRQHDEFTVAEVLDKWRQSGREATPGAIRHSLKLMLDAGLLSSRKLAVNGHLGTLYRYVQ